MPAHLDIKIFRCPICQSVLRLDDADSIICDSNKDHHFPIVRDVPRFAGESYIQSFGVQWNRYDVIRPEMDLATFVAKTGMNPSELSGKRVLDAGVGGGRYARLIGKAGAQVIGLDLSSAVDKARSVCSDLPNVTIAQADLLNPPLVDGQFDFAYSIGVLHHCPDPHRAFQQVARAVRPGGGLAVWLYRRNTLPQEWLNSALRAVTTRLPDSLLKFWAKSLAIPGGIPGLKQVGSKFINFSTFDDRDLRICDNYDWYAPTYQSHHTLDELRTWFLEAGFDEPRELRPEKRGRLYEWVYDHDMIIGSGVNMVATKKK